MYLPTKVIIFVTVLAGESLAATITSHPAKAARWVTLPRAPQDVKPDTVDGREIDWPPIRRTNFYTPETGCSPPQVACQGGKCCPSGFTCYQAGGIVGCCAIGKTCSDPPKGCGEPNSFECPARIVGCCPNGQQCSPGSQGVALCGDITGAAPLTASWTPMTKRSSAPQPSDG